MLRIVLIVVLGLVVAGIGFALVTIGPRNVVGMIRYDRRREGDLKVGDRAPDVELIALDGSSRVRMLEGVGAKPLILVFGSYT